MSTQTPLPTPRQREVLAWAAVGCSAKETARMLGCSPETVREHLEGAYRRLGAHSRWEAIALARGAGFLPEVNPPKTGGVSGGGKLSTASEGFV